MAAMKHAGKLDKLGPHAAAHAAAASAAKNKSKVISMLSDEDEHEQVRPEDGNVPKQLPKLKRKTRKSLEKKDLKKVTKKAVKTVKTDRDAAPSVKTDADSKTVNLSVKATDPDKMSLDPPIIVLEDEYSLNGY